MKKRFFSALFALLLVVLSGCAQNVLEEKSFVRKRDFDIPDRITLRVMLDPDQTRFLEHTQVIVEQFTSIYENVTIEIETMPTGADDKYYLNWEDRRAEILPEINGEMEAGGGPDIFLLAGDNNIETRLFPDLNTAMRQGYFADLNEYYMTDMDLHREGLVDEVMEAGMVNGARYLLPMAYHYRIAYVDMERLYEAGLDSRIFDEGVISLLEAVCRLGDSRVADSIWGVDIQSFLLHYFPPCTGL